MNHDSSKSLIIETERQLDCCGLGLSKANNSVIEKPTEEDHKWSIDNKVFTGDWATSECAKNLSDTTGCVTCFNKIQSKVRKTPRHVLQELQ